MTERIIEVLNKAKKVLVENGWTQNELCRDAKGLVVAPYSSKATCFCIRGAVWKAEARYNEDASRALTIKKRELYPDFKGGLASWNDFEGRQKSEVVGLIDKTIEGLKYD